MAVQLRGAQNVRTHRGAGANCSALLARRLPVRCVLKKVDGRMVGWMDGRRDGWMDGWVAGWVGGWVGGWMDGWMDISVIHSCIHVLVHSCILYAMPHCASGVLKFPRLAPAVVQHRAARWRQASELSRHSCV